MRLCNLDNDCIYIAPFCSVPNIAQSWAQLYGSDLRYGSLQLRLPKPSNVSDSCELETLSCLDPILRCGELILSSLHLHFTTQTNMRSIVNDCLADLVVVVAGLTQKLGGVHRATLPASRWLLLVNLHPVGLVVISSLTSATDVTVTDVSGDQVRVDHGACTLENGLLSVENIDTFHLTQNLETFQTGGLVNVGGDGTWLGTGTDQRVGAVDLGQVFGSFIFHLGVEDDSAGGQQSGRSGGASK